MYWMIGAYWMILVHVHLLYIYVEEIIYMLWDFTRLLAFCVTINFPTVFVLLLQYHCMSARRSNIKIAFLKTADVLDYVSEYAIKFQNREKN